MAHVAILSRSSLGTADTVTREDFQVRKNDLQSEQRFVDEARDMARALIAREYQGHGDTDPAMRRLEARYGLDYQLLWSLKYRLPKTIAVGAYMRLRSTYERVCERQAAALAAELKKARTLKDATNADSVRAAEIVLLDQESRARADD